MDSSGTFPIAEPSGFIARHGLWTADQATAAEAAWRQVAARDLHLIRVAWADSHGHSRAKSLTPPAFAAALSNGHSVGMGSWGLDASGNRVLSSFVAGGGMGLPELTGSPSFVAVPDPNTFRTLPWAIGVGWVLTDEYFSDGRPLHFSTRHLLRKVLARLADHGLEARIGLEVEFALLRVPDPTLDDSNMGAGGRRGRPIDTVPLEPGFSYDSESAIDLMQPMLSLLAEDYQALGLDLRSIEKELGGSQIECTFGHTDPLRAADNYVLFRTATRQIARRHGHLVSFMTFPGRPGLFPSGWHLHLSLVDKKTGENILMPDTAAEILSPRGRAFLAGILEHAADGSVFATPTVNGYRRFRPNSLAPDRASWARDHRGTMLRILGGPGDPATRIENRAGEPSANPYLYIASVLSAGMDGLARGAEPWPPDDAPYEADRPSLPTSLKDALGALENSEFYRSAFGDIYLDYYLRMKRSELGRYEAFLEETGTDPTAGVTAWETNEYFDFF